MRRTYVITISHFFDKSSLHSIIRTRGSVPVARLAHNQEVVGSIPAPATMTEAQKEKLVSLARELAGKPYQYGAKPEDAPNVFDCSSFIQYIFKQIDIELPRSSILQAADQHGKELAPPHNSSTLELGDVLFARGRKGHYDDDLFSGRHVFIGHVGVYLGNGEVAHSRRKLGGVKVQTLAEFTAEPNDAIVMVKRF